MYRMTKDGTNITGNQSLWRDDDYELVTTNFKHPSIKSGQHTNGPYTIWVRAIGGKWICTNMTSTHKVRQILVKDGIQGIKDIK